MASPSIISKGTLKGHNGWVTAIATSSDVNNDVVVSGSRGMLTLFILKY